MKHRLTLMVISCLCCSSAAHADLLVNLVSRLSYDRQESNTNITYSYELDNPQSNTLPVAEFAIAISRNADLTQILGPTGWTITYKPGDPVVDWTSPNPTMDLMPGSRLAFSFISQVPSGSQPYVALPKKTTSKLFTSFSTTSAPSDPPPPKP
jgi:hypothetical protein